MKKIEQQQNPGENSGDGNGHRLVTGPAGRWTLGAGGRIAPERPGNYRTTSEQLNN